MHKIVKFIRKNRKNIILLLFSIFFIVFFLVFNGAEKKDKMEINKDLFNYLKEKLLLKNSENKNVKLRMLFVGDIFLDRGIDEKAQKSELKYAYPFSGLDTLERGKYDAWVGNLECPVTNTQSTKKEKSVDLRFSCKKEYLPELKKYFDIVSLANNHTDNMNGVIGFEETKIHLQEAGIEYFGHFDNSQSNELCKVINVQNIPLAFCGYHGVFKLPTDKELEIIKNFSNKYITIVMPHQGEEYKFTNNTYQKKIYRKMIDNGADVVFGAHPHVVQNVEIYKGKKIYYSLGNFIFDQSWESTRKHLAIDVEIDIKKYDATSEVKPEFEIKFIDIPTYANLDFITKKK